MIGYSEGDDRNSDLGAINKRVLEETSRICERGMESIRRRNAGEREEVYSIETPYKI